MSFIKGKIVRGAEVLTCNLSFIDVQRVFQSLNTHWWQNTLIEQSFIVRCILMWAKCPFALQTCDSFTQLCALTFWIQYCVCYCMQCSTCVHRWFIIAIMCLQKAVFVNCENLENLIFILLYGWTGVHVLRSVSSFARGGGCDYYIIGVWTKLSKTLWFQTPSLLILHFTVHRMRVMIY